MWKKGNIEFKIPSIKEYYIDEQQTMDFNLKMTGGFRMPTLMVEEQEESHNNEKPEIVKVESQVLRQTVKKKKSPKTPRKTSACNYIVILLLMTAVSALLAYRLDLLHF
jgi:hypothetical protein